MLLSSVFTLITLATAGVFASPLEERGGSYDAKKCNSWQCKEYWPQCDSGWQPMYCGKGWGDHSCQGYYDGCDKSKVYCCYGGNCKWDK